MTQEQEQIASPRWAFCSWAAAGVAKSANLVGDSELQFSVQICRSMHSESPAFR
jgi:hypothetical protein